MTEKPVLSQLRVNDFVFPLNPNCNNLRLKKHFTSCNWQGSYKVINVLCNANFNIRQIGSHKSQCVHRMRLRFFVSQDEIADIQVNQKDLFSDANTVKDADTNTSRSQPDGQNIHKRKNPTTLPSIPSKADTKTRPNITTITHQRKVKLNLTQMQTIPVIACGNPIINSILYGTYIILFISFFLFKKMVRYLPFCTQHRNQCGLET